MSYAASWYSHGSVDIVSTDIDAPGGRLLVGWIGLLMMVDSFVVRVGGGRIR
jgi:hypothetical protein